MQHVATAASLVVVIALTNQILNIRVIILLLSITLSAVFSDLLFLNYRGICIHRNCESGLVIIHKHAAHRLDQHTLQVVEEAWTD